ncbi:MAG: hypothetical protein RBS16_06210 [Candidatus Cloacimonadales bacterium]|jgi:hypothetical protein|nr:hypothetical protein [Candidatus Cloacimonadota bacterium]MDD2649739.1 hypothetical protein [Candidatus Cloacimonadota bacterium]MDD3502404.1 hypothetical protein [Candidatus Cloacimonadota bacterium]MDX9977615.1 hypothetical protein [Candidatus Cloacimonadales bacterium]
MNIFERLQMLDRRWIFLVVAVAIIVPLIIPFNSKTYTTEPTEKLYRIIDSFAPGPDEKPIEKDRALLLVFTHDASTMPELFPMEIAILRHCFARNIKVFTLTFLPSAAPIMDYAINTVKEEFPHVKSGEHYVNFGYKIGALMLPIILGMGEDISEAVDIDAEGRKLSSLPIMKNIKNYNEMNLIMDFSGSSAGGAWIVYARSKFGANVGAGVTAVMAADEYPYLQTGQLTGMLAGLKGAAEYEKLVEVFALKKREFSRELLKDPEYDNAITNPDIPYKFKQARIGMNAQSVAHIMIIVFILIGNIGYFITKYKEKQQG